VNRPQLETIIVRRCGSLVAQAGFTLTPLATSDDLSDPIDWALRQLGVTPADPTNPSSAEVAQIAASNTDRLLDYTELRALESAATRYVGVDVTSSGESRSDNQIRQALITAVRDKRALIERTYGIVAPPLVHGRVNLHFQETYPDA
jgi:hypothetical protein